MTRSALAALAALLSPALAAGATRTLDVDDVYALKDVGDPHLSPDEKWVAYTVTTLDREEDAADSDIWMAPVAGGDAVRLTVSKKSETSPRFSPDGRYLAFLSDRDGKKTQVFLLDRRGGEAVRISAFRASVSDLAWSPDGTRLALVVVDPDPDDPELPEDDKTGAKRPPKPLVIRRLQFKRDGEGYLRELRKHIHVFDVKTRTSVQVTSGPYDDTQPAWSPDGKWLAFTSNRTPEPDSSENSDIFLVAARPGGTPHRLTSSDRVDRLPVFSPDGSLVAYVEGGDPRDMWYGTTHVSVVPVGGGPSRALTASLDRNVGPYADGEAPLRFTPDGRSILFVVEEGGNCPLARVAVGGGPVERIVSGERAVYAFDAGPKGEIVVLESRPHRPFEVSAVTGGTLRPITRTNDDFLAGIRLGPVERFKARSADGTMIDAFLVRPPDAPPGAKLPTILRIHGGPTYQYDTAFEGTVTSELQWQILAAHGYAVVAANPRGSHGYGRDFAHAIWADWGHKDLEDVMAAVDHVVAMGVADPDRLGVGGSSYGGNLTDYIITKTTRFKAAISRAGEANMLANYGTDHYQLYWEIELGLPWRTTDLWLRLSPWFDVEKVTTPTLFLCGSDDMNVPLLNSEQLYQALRRLGKPTELVIYPGEHHEIVRPSFQKDLLQRYLAWYDRYLKPGAAAATSER